MLRSRFFCHYSPHYLGASVFVEYVAHGALPLELDAKAWGGLGSGDDVVVPVHDPRDRRVAIRFVEKAARLDDAPFQLRVGLLLIIVRRLRDLQQKSFAYEARDGKRHGVAHGFVSVVGAAGETEAVGRAFSGIPLRRP
jgi:hypothetical protein